MMAENLGVSGDLSQSMLEDALIKSTSNGGWLKSVVLVVSEANREMALEITEGTDIRVEVMPELPLEDWFIVTNAGLVYSGL